MLRKVTSSVNPSPISAQETGIWNSTEQGSVCIIGPVVGLVFLVLARRLVLSGLVENAGVLVLRRRGFGNCHGERTGYGQLRVNGGGGRRGRTAWASSHVYSGTSGGGVS